MNEATEILKQILDRLDRLSANSATWLTLTDAAAYLGCKPCTLRELVTKRRIPFYRDSDGVDTKGRARGKITFRRDELDAWRMAGRVETAAESLARVAKRERAA